MNKVSGYIFVIIITCICLFWLYKCNVDIRTTDNSNDKNNNDIHITEYIDLK